MCHDDHDAPRHPAVLTPEQYRLTRRGALQRLGGAGVGLASLGGLGAITFGGADGRDAHTGQLFFADATTDRVAKLAPCSSRRVARVRNTADSIYDRGGSGSMVSMKRRSSSLRSGFAGAVTLGLDLG